MNGMGLAQQGGQSQVDMQMVAEVKAALAQGMDPAELIAQGVPVEVVEMAMQQLQQEAQQVQGATTAGGQQMAPAGLAQAGMA